MSTGADTIYQQLLSEHPEYHHPDRPTSHQETTMNLATIEQDFRQHLTELFDKAHQAEEALAPRLTELAAAAANVANSTVVQRVLSATLGPADEAVIVGLIDRLDQTAHVATGGDTEVQPGEAQPEAQPVG